MCIRETYKDSLWPVHCFHASFCLTDIGPLETICQYYIPFLGFKSTALKLIKNTTKNELEKKGMKETVTKIKPTENKKGNNKNKTLIFALTDGLILDLQIIK